jgi:4-amino-4-deoxy-L-arabinose transferase-like glycosyltransferase
MGCRVFGLLTFIWYIFWQVLFSSKAVGLLGVLILMGGRDFLLNHNMRTGVMDSLICFFLVGSFFFFRCERKKPYFYYLSGLCRGLGALTKSGAALVPLSLLFVSWADTAIC